MVRRRRVALGQGPVRIGGLVAGKDAFLGEIEAFIRKRGRLEPLFGWRAIDALRQRFGETSRHVAELCASEGIEPADLASPSRRAYQLMSYLASPGRLEGHLATLRLLEPLGRGDGRIAVRLDHTGSLYRMERRADSIRLVASEGFVGAPESVLQALISLAVPYARKRVPRLLVREFAEGPHYAATLRQVEASGGAYRSRPGGVVYNLQDLFDRVNQEYFEGRLDAPRLLWSERVPSLEFGHFEPATDTVRLSRRLDSAAVPRFVLEHVMRHELLHRVLGAERRGDRRRYHSARFRREEKTFREYQEAEAFLKQLAEG